MAIRRIREEDIIIHGVAEAGEVAVEAEAVVATTEGIQEADMDSRVVVPTGTGSLKRRTSHRIIPQASLLPSHLDHM